MGGGASKRQGTTCTRGRPLKFRDAARTVVALGSTMCLRRLDASADRATVFLMPGQSLGPLDGMHGCAVGAIDFLFAQPKLRAARRNARQRRRSDCFSACPAKKIEPPDGMHGCAVGASMCSMVGAQC